MLDITTVVQIAAIAVLALAAVGFIDWLFEGGARKRLMRCPETGAVAFVGANAMSRGEGRPVVLMVHSCELWPARKDCARGCLARFEETTPGYRIKLDALRPFDQPRHSG
jgi:hypothetical protein